jgi:hypothetical protein
MVETKKNESLRTVRQRAPQHFINQEICTNNTTKKRVETKNIYMGV